MNTDPHKLAASLSEAQKRALLCARDGVIPSYYPTALRIASPTFRNLARNGLTERWPPKLTELGSAVRAVLIEDVGR